MWPSKRFTHLLADPRQFDVEGADRRQRLSFCRRSEKAAQRKRSLSNLLHQLGAVGKFRQSHHLPMCGFRYKRAPTGSISGKRAAHEGAGQPMRLGSDPDFSLMPELFAESLRPHLHAFSRFVRLADAVTDNNALARDEKLARLTALEAALTGGSRAPLVARGKRGGARSAQQPAGNRHSGRAHPTHPAGVPTGRARPRLRRLARPDGVLPVRRRTHWPLYAAFGRRRHQAAAAVRPMRFAAALHILRQLRDCEDPTIHFNRLCIPRQFLDDAMITPQYLRAPIGQRPNARCARPGA